MKILIISLLTFSIHCITFGQTFSVSTDSLIRFVYTNQWPSDYIYIQNFSGTAIDLKYELITNTFVNNNWTATLCTHQYCMPNIPDSASFGTLADSASGFFNLHAGFNNIPGIGQISFKIFEANNPSNVDTINFIYTAEQPSEIFSNFNENFSIIQTLSKLILKAPEQQSFNFEIISLEGKKMILEKIENGGEIELSAFASGIYIINIYSGNKIWLTRKIHIP